LGGEVKKDFLSLEKKGGKKGRGGRGVFFTFRGRREREGRGKVDCLRPHWKETQTLQKEQGKEEYRSSAERLREEKGKRGKAPLSKNKQGGRGENTFFGGAKGSCTLGQRRGRGRRGSLRTKTRKGGGKKLFPARATQKGKKERENQFLAETSATKR